MTAVLRAGWAGVLLLLPEQLLRAAGPAPVPAAAVAVARVLGARHLLQAVASAVAPAGPVPALGAVVDGLHTASCVGLAVVSSRWRRAALLDAVVEAGLTAARVRHLGARAADRRIRRAGASGDGAGLPPAAGSAAPPRS